MNRDQTQVLRTMGRNLVLDDHAGEAWSVYRLHPGAAASASDRGRGGTVSIRALDETLGCDFSLVRLTRRWSPDEYAIGLEASADIRHARRDVLRRYVRAQSATLERLHAYTADVILTVLLEPAPGRGGRGGEWVFEAEACAHERLLRCAAATRVTRSDLARLLGGGGGRIHRACLALQLGGLQSAGRLASLVARLSAELDDVDPPYDAAVTVHADPAAPPAAQVKVSVGVGAEDRAELRRHVARLADEFDGAWSPRCIRGNVDLFRAHLPHVAGPHGSAGRARVGVDLGSFRLSRAAIGSDAGAYIGRTNSPNPRPVLLDPFEARRAGAPSAVLVAGGARTGKTLCLELIMHNALIAGAAVVDVDLGGAHALERVADVDGRASVLELSAVRRFRGLLDPLRIAGDELGERLAVDFLTAVLPHPLPPGWHQQIADAVRRVARAGRGGCADVVDELRSRGSVARAAARAIDAAASSGPAALAYGGDAPVVQDAPAAFTSLRLRDLGLGGGGEAEPDAWRAQRTARVVARLLVAHAQSIARAHRGRECLLAIDDAAILLEDARGRAVIDHLLAGAPEAGVVTLMATREPGLAGWLSDRCGVAMCFAVRDRGQMAGAAALLGADECQEPIRGLLGAAPGAAVLRDWRRRIAPVEVELADERLRAALGLRPIGGPAAT